MNNDLLHGTVTRYHHSLLERENGSVRKLIEPESSFLPNGREQLIQDMLEFRKRLQSFGVPISSYYELSIKEGVIVEETTNCGIDGYVAIKDGKGLGAEEILRKITRALLPVLLGDEIEVVPDPHPANWCFDKHGNVRYIDFQPARFRREDGVCLVGFPQPLGRDYEWAVNRYYSKLGLIRMLRFNAMRAGGSSIDEIFTRVIRSELPLNVFKELQEMHDDLPERRVRGSRLSMRDALCSCDEWCVDDVREIAMLVADKLGSGGENFLSQVLDLTRADFNLSVETRREGVEKAKQFILAQSVSSSL